MEKYTKNFPDVTPSRLEKTRAYLMRLQLGNACKYPQVHYLRRNRKYIRDKENVRRKLGIPPGGLGIRDAKRMLTPLYQAYILCENEVRGSYKYRTEAGCWLAIFLLITKFADRHPLKKSVPMPLHIAFSEIVYKNPKFFFQLRGYFDTDQDRNLHVYYEDGVTEAPQPIRRLVSYKLRGDNNQYTRMVRISNRFADSGRWQIRQNK